MAGYESDVPDVVSRPIERVYLGIIRGVASADMAVVEARKAAPGRGEMPLVLDVAIDGDLGHLVNRAAYLLRAARSLLGYVRVRVADAEAERELCDRPAAQFELEAGAASGARVARDPIAAQRE
jgi:hypothetical protein